MGVFGVASLALAVFDGKVRCDRITDDFGEPCNGNVVGAPGVQDLVVGGYILSNTLV